MSDAEPTSAQPSTGRRIVSSLSASQIQHKRDLDRKAQRALRQRTKIRIQELENDLSRFKESVSEREKAMIEENRQLREENRHLKVSLQKIGQFALGKISKDTEICPTRNGSLGDIHEGLDRPASGSPIPAAHSPAQLASSLTIPNNVTYPGSEAAISAAQQHEFNPPMPPSSILGTLVSSISPLPRSMPFLLL